MLLKQLLLISFATSALSFPFITLVPVAIAGYFGIRNYVPDFTCQFRECCSNTLNSNISQFKHTLDTQLYGQSFASVRIFNNIRTHLSDEDPAKALVLLLTGPVGSGKSHASKIIVENLYSRAYQSRFVHFFEASSAFPNSKALYDNIARVITVIESSLKACDRSLFIFDEMEKFPTALVDSLVPFLDYTQNAHHSMSKKSIFLFLSHHAHQNITQYAYDFFVKGGDRNSISYKTLNRLVQSELFNAEGGFKNSELIKKHLITATIPFLPLQREHILQCIMAEAKDKQFMLSDEIIEEIIGEMEWFPKGQDMFSITGCKHIKEKLGYFITYHAPISV